MERSILNDRLHLLIKDLLSALESKRYLFAYSISIEIKEELELLIKSKANGKKENKGEEKRASL